MEPLPRTKEDLECLATALARMIPGVLQRAGEGEEKRGASPPGDGGHHEEGEREGRQQKGRPESVVDVPAMLSRVDHDATFSAWVEAEMEKCRQPHRAWLQNTKDDDCHRKQNESGVVKQGAILETTHQTNASSNSPTSPPSSSDDRFQLQHYSPAPSSSSPGAWSTDLPYWIIVPNNATTESSSTCGSSMSPVHTGQRLELLLALAMQSQLSELASLPSSPPITSEPQHDPAPSPQDPVSMIHPKESDESDWTPAQLECLPSRLAALLADVQQRRRAMRQRWDILASEWTPHHRSAQSIPQHDEENNHLTDDVWTLPHDIKLEALIQHFSQPSYMDRSIDWPGHGGNQAASTPAATRPVEPKVVEAPGLLDRGGRLLEAESRLAMPTWVTATHGNHNSAVATSQRPVDTVSSPPLPSPEQDPQQDDQPEDDQRQRHEQHIQPQVPTTSTGGRPHRSRRNRGRKAAS